MKREFGSRSFYLPPGVCFGFASITSGANQSPLTAAGNDMIKPWQSIDPLLFLLVATTLEVSGDAVVRLAIYHRAGVPGRQIVTGTVSARS